MPDYIGNGMFNTPGNLRIDTKPEIAFLEGAQGVSSVTPNELQGSPGVFPVTVEFALPY